MSVGSSGIGDALVQRLCNPHARLTAVMREAVLAGRALWARVTHSISMGGSVSKVGNRKPCAVIAFIA